MRTVYFETSAADYLLNMQNGSDALATRELQIEKGRNWQISTTTLWELMQIKDFKKYDQYFFNATFLFDNKLLKSTSEILIDYTKSTFVRHRKKEYSECLLAKHWEKACIDRRYSFNIMGTQIIDMTNNLKRISRYIAFIIQYREIEYDETIDQDIKEIKALITAIYEELFSDSVVNQIIWLRKIAILVCFLVICCGYDIARDKVEEYWEKVRILSPIERLIYLKEKRKYIFQSGPLWLIANVILIQLSKNRLASRGALHDGLHSLYLPYTDCFFTKDQHFIEIRDVANNSAYKTFYHKIYHLDEMYLKIEQRMIKNPFIPKE